MEDIDRIDYLLAEGGLPVFIELAEELASQARVKIIQEPSACLVMMQVFETVQGHHFNLGEVLITECAVEIEGTYVQGFALGDEPQRALCAALLKGAIAGKHPLAPKILSVFAEQENTIQQRKKTEFSLVARTRVDFEVMDHI